MIFADKDNPIRCSKLAFIVKCSARTFMLKVINASDEDDGEEAAQTGSVVHAGVAAFHQSKANLNIRKGAALEAIKNAAPKFPASRPKRS